MPFPHGIAFGRSCVGHVPRCALNTGDETAPAEYEITVPAVNEVAGATTDQFRKTGIFGKLLLPSPLAGKLPKIVFRELGICALVKCPESRLYVQLARSPFPED